MCNQPEDFGSRWNVAAVKEAEKQAWVAGATLYQEPLVLQWLDEARQIISDFLPEDLASLSLEARRSLSAASLQFWQQRISPAQSDYESDECIAKLIAAHVTTHGSADLIEDLDLATKAQASLRRSTLYDSNITKTADEIVKAYPSLTAGDLPAKVVEIQSSVWRTAALEDCSDLPAFKVITEKADLQTDCYLPQPDGTGIFYIGPSRDDQPHWLDGNLRHQVWLIAHEHLHHIQWHLFFRKSEGILVSPDLQNDICAASFQSDYNVPMFNENVFSKTGKDDSADLLWRAAHTALYLSNRNEAAAFHLHDKIIAKLTKKFGPERIPLQKPNDVARLNR